MLGAKGRSDMVRITAAELQKNFGRYRDIARREPVSVTHHGRDSVVVLSAEEYARLSALDTRRAYRIAELPDDLAEALESAEIPSAAKRHDAEVG